MLSNCSRLETLLLRLSHVFLAQHYGLTPSATYCKSGEEPSAPGTRDRSAKARQPCRTAGKVVPPGQPLLLQGPFLKQQHPQLHVRNASPPVNTGTWFTQLRTSVASSHMSENKTIKGSNTGARIQSTASEGQTGPLQKRNLLAQTANYWQDRDANSNKAD